MKPRRAAAAPCPEDGGHAPLDGQLGADVDAEAPSIEEKGRSKSGRPFSWDRVRLSLGRRYVSVRGGPGGAQACVCEGGGGA